MSRETFSLYRVGRHAPITVIALLLLTEPAHGQHCSALESSGADAPTTRLGVEVSAASYATSRFEGTYVGVRPTVTWSHPRVRLFGAMPWYRIERNGLPRSGIGDVLLGVEATLVRPKDSVFSAGIATSASLPTGSARSDLGMGHAMSMSSLWFDARTPRFSLRTSVGYGRALMGRRMSMSHHAMQTGGPIVDPMNASELEASLVGSVRVIRTLRIRAGVFGAIPVGAESGSSRASVLGGLEGVVGDRLDLGVEIQTAVVGNPFRSKFLARVGVRF